MKINRRRFIKLGSLTSAGLPFFSLKNIGNIQDKLSTGPVALDEELYKTFKNPGNIYRPFVRWWWNGDRLQKNEILRELDIMKAAGIGGVEINPIKFPSNTDDLNIKSLEWLSDDWISMLQVALKGAKERNMYCDMIVGSGWPFGGEFLSREDQTQMAALGTRNLAGDKVYKISKEDLLNDVNPEIHSKYEDKLKDLMMIKLVPLNVQDLNENIDLTDQIKNDFITVSVPTGEYVLYYLVKLTGYMAVINGAPGAGGPVLNHYSKSAVENYLNRMSDKLVERIGPLGNYFRAFFTDSLELEGANWCSDMFEQFKEKKGYDLAPYFPFILFKVGEMGNAIKEEYGAKFEAGLQKKIDRVRYDFEDTRVELFKERFMDTFVNWCHKNGVKSRMQAYGRECNPVEASMLLDIPECETWMDKGTGYEFSDEDYRIGRAYTMSNKFVSSGAHLADKKEISCEEMTNTEMVFNATLERIKISGDQSILSGVTHSVLHGFNYSPLEAPFPGWIRYGTFLNERNTWWPYFKKWADYKTRLYAVLQQSEMQADIAILPPLADLSMKFGFQRDPFPVFAYPKYVYQVWEAIHQNGSGCDYVTENIIQQASITNGMLSYGSRNYKTLFLIDVDSLLPATAKAIKKFTDGGGKLICIEKVPSKSPTNQKIAEGGSADIPDILKDTDPARAGIVPAPVENFVAWYKKIQQQFDIKPFVEISNPDKFVSQVYCRSADKDIFFFSNYSATKEHLLTTKFFIKGKNAWLWDPQTGERFLYPLQNNELKIHLGPAESRLIIFDTEQNGQKFMEPDISKKTAIIIKSPWKVSLKDRNGKSTSITLDKLIDFSQREDLKTFGGSIIYENTFALADARNVKNLQLGETHGVAEIKINNQKVGMQWYGNPVYDISRFVRKGNNTIQVKVITTLGNYMKSLKENEVAQIWTSHQSFFPVGLIGPVRIL
ncbi:MAG: glycosyl hydrolase [Ginsengibacter sp.]